MLYFYLIAHIVTVSLFQTAIRELKESMESLERFRRTVLRYSRILAGFGVTALAGSSMLSEPAVVLAFGADMRPYHAYLPVFMGFIVVGSFVTFLEQLLIFLQQNRVLRRVALGALALSLVVCPVLVARHGLGGAITYMYTLFTVKLVVLHFTYRARIHAELAV